MSIDSTARPTGRRVRAALLTSVGGSVLQRLQDALPIERGKFRVVSSLSAERWRAAMRGSGLERVGTRLVAYGVFPLKAVAAAVSAPRDEVFVASTNPFFLPAVMVATRALHRRRVVVLVYDLFPEAAIAAGATRESSLSSRVMRAVNRFSLSRADGVVFIGKHMAARVKALYGVPRASRVIETGAVASEFSRASIGETEASSLRQFCDGKLVLSYVGNLGHVHDWLTMAEGLKPLFRELTNFVVVIAASGANVRHLKDRWAGVSVDQLRFEEPLDDTDWCWLMATTDIALVTLKESAKQTSIPSKTFSAMAAGSAIVAVAPAGSDLRDVCEKHGAGVAIEPGDAQHFTSALRKLLQDNVLLTDMKAHALNALSQHYEMSVLAEKWADFLAELP